MTGMIYTKKHIFNFIFSFLLLYELMSINSLHPDGLNYQKFAANTINFEKDCFHRIY